MGICSYCGQNAGLFRSKHNECQKRYDDGLALIASKASSAIYNGSNMNELEASIALIERDSYIPSYSRKNNLVSGWEQVVNTFLDDGILDESEEKKLIAYKDHFGLNDIDLDKNGYLTKVVKAAVIRDLTNGIIPNRLDMQTNLPVNLQKNEQIIWVFSDSKYFEDKVRRSYVGSSAGVSIRIAKGVYYRTSAFKGRQVENIERTLIDNGYFIVTNKNIYFIGMNKSVRVPYSKIVSFIPLPDGIGVLKDSATAKPQIFINGDGWFSYNLIENVTKL